jgi:hypothetical protein
MHEIALGESGIPEGSFRPGFLEEVPGKMYLTREAMDVIKRFAGNGH